MVDLSKFVSDESRRSVLKKGALATAGAGLVGSGVGSAAAQQDGTDENGDGLGQEWDKALMYVGQARPDSQFVITSPVLEWSPDIEEIRDNIWSDYNTRVIRYLNTGEQVLFWQAHEADVPEYDDEAGYVVDAEGDTAEDGTPQPEVFRFHTEWSPFGDAAFVTVNFTPVGEDEEDDWLDAEDWWLDDDQGENGGASGNATGNQTSG